MSQIKLKIYKLDRDNRKNIIQQIEWLKTETQEEFDCDYIKELFPMNKKELIKVWVELVTKLNYPELDWIQIYY